LINHRRIKLRLYQTLANIWTEKLYHTLFPFPEEALPRKRKTKKKKRKKRYI
jgi:hypothetical protein